MATNQQFKLTSLAKSLGMKSKDLTEILSSKGIEVKTTSKTLDNVEFDTLMDHLTKENQITDIGAYLDGKIKIKTSKPVKKEPEEKKEKEVSAPVDAGKTESVDKAKSDGKEKKETVKGGKASPKAPEKESGTAKAEGKTTKEAEKPIEKAVSGEKTTTDTKTAPSQKPEGQPQTQRQPQKPYTGNPFRPKDNGLASNYGMRPQNAQPRTSNNTGNFNNANNSGRFAQNRDNTSRPMGDRPGFNGQRPTQNGNRPTVNGTRPATNGNRFGNNATGNRTQGGFGGTKPALGNVVNGIAHLPNGNPDVRSFGFVDKKEPVKKKNNNRFNQNNGDDKGGYVQSGPKDTFKAKEIVRGASSNVNPDGTLKGPRVIDTHGSNVDLSKYDDKLETYASDRDNEMTGGTQRLKKQNSDAQGNQSFSRNGRNKKGGKKTAVVNTVKPTSITLPEEISVGQLASRLMVTSGEVVKKLVLMGVMANVNQVVDFDTAALVADEFGVSATQEVQVTIEEKLFDAEEDAEENLVTRAPVICVMGHVDHGKTSILDAIRNTSVTKGEAGGITQHIGAYRVKAKGHDITFLDTPGHAAFTAMRARGAMATDIAILVVAADDGIMPQTVEAINHAKAAGIDIVVAINKMDKPTANPDNVKQELTKYDLVPEEWGGDVMCVPVSALTGKGIDDLLEAVLLVAEVKDLKANPNRRAKGIVIEAKLDKGRGPVATVLVQNGTMRSGDILIAGTAVGRVRSMTDHNGKIVKEAGPSVPVEITGLAEVPSAGDEFQVVADERMARELADKRKNQAKEANFKEHQRANLNDLFAQISEGVKDLNVIVKADVDGSVEAVKQSLEKLSNDEVKVRVIHGAAGGITEGDVTFAAASNAIIVGFNVRPDKSALDSAERQEVEIRTYRVIYECIDEIKSAMAGMLAPKFKEALLGHAEVRQTIHVPNVGTIAGSYVQDGKVTRTAQIRVVRDGVVIFEDKISSLKRFKDDAKEVAAGYECGIGLEKFNDIKVGDILEAFAMEQIEAEL